MSKLLLLKSMGFYISWKTIYIGLYGYEEIPASLTREEVLDFLDGLLTSTNKHTDNIISLICEKDDCVMFDRLLKKLACNDCSNIAIEKRKWRSFLLKELLDNISNDYLQGLLELMEFWISMGEPENCPQPFPNNNDIESVQNYFTDLSYSFLVKKNYAWLTEEVSTIINNTEKASDSYLS